MMESEIPRFIGWYRKTEGRLAAALLTATLFLGGCSLLPGHCSVTASDQALFQQGIDALPVTDSPAAFSRLAAEFPDSPWTARAKSIEKVLLRLKEEQRERSQLQKKSEECLVERERLAKDVRSLEEHARRLKALLTEAGISEPVPPSR